VNPPSFLKNILDDFVEKKLWPVAIILIGALIALPLTLGRSSEPAVVQEIAATQTATDEGQDALAAYTGVDTEKTEGGKTRDPFVAPNGLNKPQPAPKVASTGGGAATSGGSSGGSAGTDVPAGSVPGLDDVDVVPVGGSGGSSGSDTTKKNEKATYSVDLRFGQDGKLSARTDVPRLSPLPSADDPFFVFLGVLADGKTSTFLVSSDAEATGDAKCLPSATNCERVEMKAGDTEFFDVVTPDGQTKQYQLDVVRVQRETKATAAVASAARAREDASGRQVLRTAVETKQVNVSDLAYSRDLGVIVPSGIGQDQAGSLFGGYRVDLKFGHPDELIKRYNLARLTPLPSVEEPTFVYLGVMSDGKSAIFLNPSEAAASGDAVCDPTPEDCQRVTLKQGDSAMFDVATLAGSTTQYQLDIDGISELKATTAEEAAELRKRESPAGRVILRRLVNEVGSLVQDLSFSVEKSAVVKGAAPQQPSTTPAAPPTPGTKPEAAAQGDTGTGWTK
jgi:hypothetical protein